MKKFLSVILAILLVTALGVTTVFAAGEGAALTAAQGAPGQTVYVDLSLSGFEDANTVAITVTSETLTLDTAKSSWAVTGQLKQIQKYADGEWRCVWGWGTPDGETKVTDVNGKFLTLAFQIPAEGDSHSYSCTVTVKNGTQVLAEVTASGTVNVVRPATGVSLNTSNLKLDLCGTATATLEATVTPDNTTDDLTWSVDDTEVATVSADGVVTAKKVGLATITAKAGDRTAICVVTVNCSHRGGEATCLEKAVCEVCGAAYGDREDHYFPEEVWDYDKDAHWQLCMGCMVETANKGEHVFSDSEDGDCNICHAWRMLVPTGLESTTVASSGKPKITWSKFDEATAAQLAGYEVYRAESKNGEYVLLGSTTKTSYTDKTAEAGIQYYYKVKALGTYIIDSALSSAKACTCDLPQPEMSVATEAVTGKPQLKWDKITGASKYYVYRSLAGKDDFEKIATVKTNSYLDESAKAGTKYTYKVKAIHSNTSANSAYSDTKNSTCDLAQPVVEESNVTSSGKIKLKWEKISGAEKYKIYRRVGKSGDYEYYTSTTKTSYTDKDTKAGKVYYYKVLAVHENTSANSAKSAGVGQTCKLAQPVVEESNVASSGKIKLKWEKISGAEKYKIYRRVGKSGDYEYYKSTTSTSYTDKDTKAGKVYYYKVLAVHENTSANSAKSDGVGQTCKLPRPEVSIKLSSGNPKLTWEEVDGAVKYEIYRATSKDGTYKSIKTTTSLKYTDKSVTAGKTYYYKVVAIHSNTSANSAKSSVVSIKAK